jgi:hypothetical protein
MIKRRAPKRFDLELSFPDLFNPSVIIGHRLPAVSHVSLKVYDAPGREVRPLVDEREDAGYYDVAFYADNLPSGVYSYRIEAGYFRVVSKFVLLRN